MRVSARKRKILSEYRSVNLTLYCQVMSARTEEMIANLSTFEACPYIDHQFIDLIQ